MSQKQGTGRKKSKLGRLLDERGLKLKDFGTLVFEKTGYFIEITNLSNFCTGHKSIKALKTALYFAKTLDVLIEDIIDEEDYKIEQ